MPLLAVLLAACASPERSAAGPEVLSRVVLIDDAREEPKRPDLSTSPRMGLLLTLALERNPRIRAARERAEAAAEAPLVEGWLPNPEVVVGWYDESVQTRVGPQEWSLGIQQRLPFPTKLRTRSRIGAAEARRAAVAYERTVRDVLTEVVETTWEIVYLDEARTISAEIAALLSRYVAATTKGDALLSEHFRASTQQAQLENDLVVLAELRAVEAARLRSLLALPPGAPVGTPVGVALPEVEAGFERLLAVAIERNQELVEAGIAEEAASLRTSLAEQSRLPDLTIGATRIFTERLDGSIGDPDGNGRDPVILRAGASIPLWFHRDAAAIRRAKRLERAAEEERIETAQRVRERLARAWYAVGNAERLHRLYRDVLVPRAAVAARTAEDLLAAGKGSTAGLLETIAVLHNFRLAEARARSDHGRAIAALEAVLGRPLAPSAREEE
jgi:outer membrane protein TolC